MASLSYQIIQDLIKLRESYYDDDNYAGSGVVDLAESHVDGISKKHLPSVEYLDMLTSIFSDIASDSTDEQEQKAMQEIIELVDSYRAKFAL